MIKRIRNIFVKLKNLHNLYTWTFILIEKNPDFIYICFLISNVKNIQNIPFIILKVYANSLCIPFTKLRPI